jgi:hypothetical protein
MVGTGTVAYQRRPGVRVACLLIWINNAGNYFNYT